MSQTTANGLTRRNFFIPDALYGRMQKHAIQTGEVVSEHMRLAMAEYLSKHERASTK